MLLVQVHRGGNRQGAGAKNSGERREEGAVSFRGKKLPPQLRRKPLGEKRGKRREAAYNALRGTSI